MNAIVQLTFLVKLEDEDEVAAFAISLERGAREEAIARVLAEGYSVGDLSQFVEFYGTSVLHPRHWEPLS